MGLTAHANSMLSQGIQLYVLHSIPPAMLKLPLPPPPFLILRLPMGFPHFLNYFPQCGSRSWLHPTSFFFLFSFSIFLCHFLCKVKLISSKHAKRRYKNIFEKLGIRIIVKMCKYFAKISLIRIRLANADPDLDIKKPKQMRIQYCIILTTMIMLDDVQYMTMTIFIC
jgi:hypothetical protein